jgi:hypothetical protein
MPTTRKIRIMILNSSACLVRAKLITNSTSGHTPLSTNAGTVFIPREVSTENVTIGSTMLNSMVGSQLPSRALASVRGAAVVTSTPYIWQ